MPRRKTNKEFINEANTTHNKFYTYSKTKYVNSTKHVIITCPIHGDFKQAPYSHLNGRGCPKCKSDKITTNSKYTTKQFIDLASNKHSNFYKYLKVEYIHSKIEIIITCPIHGDFKQTPAKHLKGQGCPKCSGKYKWNTNEWIIEAKNTHPNENYDYSKSIYINNKTELIIICPMHGEFKQTPNNHVNNRQRCSLCSKKSKGEIEISNILLSKNIQYYTQKTFNTCKDKRKLPFDFYIPSLKLLIEYDGIQHFKPVEHFGNQQGYLKTIKHDILKNEFAKKEGIQLIRIPYWDHNNIENILNNALAN